LLSLGAWRSFMKGRPTAESNRSLGQSRGPVTLKKVPDDGSVFRVGMIGAKPPSFLSPAVAQEVAEMFTYRLAEPDPTRLDIRRTIAERARGGDSSIIYFQSRRQLPTILLLVDSSSDAMLWNTLPDEFASGLTKWGVAFERIEFSGTLFA